MIGWPLFAAGAVAVALGGFAGGYGLRDLMADADAGRVAESALQAERDARAADRGRDLATYLDGLEFGKQQARTHEVYRTIQERVPVYVTPQTDAAYPVPVGSVRLHDAAAVGSAVTPDPAGRANDAPSGVAASTYASTVADNYGSCRADLDRFAALQAWVTKQTGAK